MLRWMFSAVPWEAASQKQQKNKQNKTKKNQQTLGNTDRRSSTRQSINTQRSKHRYKRKGKAEVNPPSYWEGTDRHTATAFTAQRNWTVRREEGEKEEGSIGNVLYAIPEAASYK